MLSKKVRSRRIFKGYGECVIVTEYWDGMTTQEGFGKRGYMKKREAECARIDWGRLGKSVQIVHASRSCIRDCKFCGVKRIEPEISFKSWPEVRDEIQLNDVVFFDNNFLMNPHHKEILEGIASLKIGGKVVRCEAQSGFDPRLLTLETARLLKKARFPRGKNNVVFKGYSDCGCNAGFRPGIVLDLYMGSGTTAVEALRQGKLFCGIELNPGFVEIADRRIKPFLEQKRLNVRNWEVNDEVVKNG